MNEKVLQPKWHTVNDVAAMLGFGLSKTKMLVAERKIRSVKVGRNRRILPEWVDDYVKNCTEEAEDDWTIAG